MEVPVIFLAIAGLLWADLCFGLGPGRGRPDTGWLAMQAVGWLLWAFELGASTDDAALDVYLRWGPAGRRTLLALKKSGAISPEYLSTADLLLRT